MKQWKRKTKAQFLFMIIGLIICIAGKKGTVYAEPYVLKLNIHMNTPMIGEYPSDNSNRDIFVETEGYEVVDYDQNGYTNGVKWTDGSNKPVDITKPFHAQDYIVHILVARKDGQKITSTVDGKLFGSNGAMSSGMKCEGYATDYGNYKDLAVTIYQDKSIKGIECTLDTPVVGEELIKSIKVTKIKADTDFDKAYLESKDYSKSWVEATAAGGPFKQPADVSFRKRCYYKTRIPDLLYQDVLKALKDPASKTSYIGLNDTIECKINDITYTVSYNYDKNRWDLTDPYYACGMAKEMISEVDLTGLELPEAGKKPDRDYSIPNDAGYVKADPNNNNLGTYVSWMDLTEKELMDASDTFIEGHVYRAYAAVQLKDEGYAFSEKLCEKINGESVKTENMAGRQRVNVEFDYSFPTIGVKEQIRIKGVCAPVAGEKPSTEGWSSWPIGNDKCDISQPFWYVVDQNDPTKDSQMFGDTFEKGRTYRLKFWLEGKMNQYFSDWMQQLEQMNISVEGATSCKIERYNSTEYYNMLYISAEFETKSPITSISISGYKPPRTGTTASYDGFSVKSSEKYEIYSGLNSDLMKNGIEWGRTMGGTDVGTQAKETLIFEKDRAYYTDIVVKAKEGELFPTDLTKITATVSGYPAEVDDCDIVGEYVIVRVRNMGRDNIKRMDYTIPTPVVGQKPGKITFETIPANAMKGGNEFDSSAYWQVSEDGVHYVNMDPNAVFEAGNYYRTNVYGMHQIALLIVTAFGDVYNRDVTYGLDAECEKYINGKSVDEEGTLQDSVYFCFDRLAEAGSGETPEGPGGGSTEGPGGNTGKNEGGKPGEPVEGVGTISPDQKILTDENGKQYQIEENMKPESIEKDALIADKKSGGKYRITKIVKKGGKVTGGTVEYMAPYNINCTKIAATEKVKLAGISFKVTSIAPDCAKGCGKLQKLVIGSNVTSIGKNAFNGCKKLKSITIKTKKLTKKKVGKNAFKDISAKAKVKVPAKKLRAYRAILKACGIKGKKQKITK